MALRLKSGVTLLAVALSLGGGILATGTSLYGQSPEMILNRLSPEALQSVGVHLPSYLSSVQAQMAYQSKVPLHQEITLKWSAGAESQEPASAGFSLVKRQQHVQKTAIMSTIAPNDQPILVVATTPEGEVRAFALCVDTRATTGQLDIQLPQDGQISKLIFLHLVGGAGLEYIGDVKLGSPDGTLRSGSKDKASLSATR